VTLILGFIYCLGVLVFLLILITAAFFSRHVEYLWYPLGSCPRDVRVAGHVFGEAIGL
jgi:hypothetical protein